MGRGFVTAGVCALASGVVGCASTWDTITSKDFKDQPFTRMFSSDDPLHTLRTNPAGGARAQAMYKLKEPSANGGSQADQDEVVQILGKAAADDPSPVVRAAAIDALARFKDDRAPQLLLAAFNKASGAPAEPPKPPITASVIQPVGAGGRGDKKALNAPRFGLYGPTGFPPDTVAMLRTKALDGMAHTGKPEAIKFLTDVALAAPKETDPSDRDTRLAAVRALGTVRQPEAVPALAKVLAAETNNDAALAGRAHAGLVELTGKDLPADPDEWKAVVQAGGYTVAPESSLIQRVTGTQP